ncbi:MAG: HAMP domain-containing sensor histidine kinase [Verrucomicrobiota bacterium]
MKTSRSLLIWATLALCGVMVLGAMTWLTRGVLASEKERAGAEARADLEERTRLALWRMDAAGAAIVSGENRHPPADYEPGSSPFPAASGPWVRLHFELRESGKLFSPESAGTKEKLSALGTLLSQNPLPGDEWLLLKCAAEASEANWGLIPKDAPVEKSNNTFSRQMKSSASNRSDNVYQQNFNGVERAQRAKTVGETVSQAAIPPQAEQQRAGEIQLLNFSGPQIADLGTLRAVWVGGDLFLLRQLTMSLAGRLEKGVQGVWLDQDSLKQRLLAEVKDLLPGATLAVATDPAQDPLALVSFPLRLAHNESLVMPAATLNRPLLIGWIAVVLALLTASLLVHGVMRLSERRASFVSAVTHELRTPLTTFRLYSDMLASGAVKPEKRGDYLRVLSREADRLSHLVENVLSFSKIERGSARSVVRESTVAGLLEPMRDRFEARLATAGLTLEMDTACQHRVRVDSAAVEHILFNLIDNAAKYASAGDPPKVSIQVKSVDRNVGIVVTDHGPGIPLAERRRIFRAFHKSAREAAESRPGVGLGLALSRRLAKSLGGGLECVDSESGACFVLRLPLV